MPVNVSEAIDADTASLVTLEDREGGGYVDGIFIPGEPPVIRKALGSIQQPTPQQLTYLEGSERKQDLRSIYLNRAVRLAEDDKSATQLYFKGDVFKIIYVGDWNEFGWFFAIGAKL